MEKQNSEIFTSSKPTLIENSKGLSDAAIIEIVHGIKEIIIELIQEIPDNSLSR